MSHKSWKTWAAASGLAIVAIVLPGCQYLPGLRPGAILPIDRPAGATTALAPADRQVLARAVEKDRHGQARSVWVQAVEESPYRWRYRDLEELIARPPHQRPNFRRASVDADIIVASNAAIALARLEDEAAVEPLVRAVRAPILPPTMRRAAVESLAALHSPRAADALRELLAQYGNEGHAAAGVYLSDLHAELLGGLALHAEPKDDDTFRAGLGSRSVDVKLAALKRWTTGGDMPAEALDLRGHSDSRVRVALLEALRATRHRDALPRAAEALHDHDLAVRLAAIDCLGHLGGESARAELRPMLDANQSESIRAAAVAALARDGAKREVLDAVADASWRVRQRVAESLDHWPDAEGTHAARQLLADPSVEVRRQVVASLAGWPVEQSGPLLLTAMDSPAFGLRREAGDALARHWPAASEYQFDASAERRRAVLDRLEAAFRRDHPAAVFLASATVSAAGRLSAAECEQIDGLIEQLGATEIIQRRRAASDLARWGAKQPLPPKMVERLYARAAAEPDALVWQSLLTAVDGGGPAADQLAYAGLSHSSAEVRRRACELLADNPGPRHARVLLPTLDDKNTAVVVAALKALAAGGQIDDREPVQRLLGSSNAQVGFAATVALARVGDRAGLAALERAVYHVDPQLQRQAAEAMGQLADPAFVPALVHLLDGQVSVQRAALDALPRCLGRDVAAEGDPPKNTSERISRWKQWAARNV